MVLEDHLISQTRLGHFSRLQSYHSSRSHYCNPGWNIKISDDKTQMIYFCPRIRLPESFLTLNGQNIRFVNYVKYLGVIFDRKIGYYT
jgi:hypothetical protein